MKTAIYVRVSTNAQYTDGYSLDSQINLCLQKGKELEILKSDVEIYREEGVSGEDLDRPELNKLRSKAELGLIDRVLCVHPDRLSRDLTDKLIICRELEKYEIDLVFVDSEYKNTPEGQLFFNMQSSIAQYELALIKKRTTRGRLEAVRKEEKVMPMRVAPYGYDLIDSKLIINEKEAIFVKKIYAWYVDEKLTLREIGESLYELNAMPKRKESRNWSASSIRRVLTSPIYIGKYYYNKRKTKKVKGEKTLEGNPRKTYTIRDQKKWLVIEVPAIIDKELYNLAQEQRVKNTKRSGNQKFDYLLKSLLRCARCGRMYQVTTYSGRIDKKTGEKKKYPVYRCPNIYPKKYGPEIKKCKSRSIRADLLEEYIWNIITQAINSPNEIMKHYKLNFDESIVEIQSTLDLLDNNLQNKDKERERIKRIFIKGFIDEDEMTKEFKDINNTIMQLEEKRLKYAKYIEEYNKNIMNDKQIEKALKNIGKLLHTKSSKLSFKEKRFLVENLIEEISLKFDENLEVVNVNIFGSVNQMLSNNNFDLESCSQSQEVRQYR